MRIFNQKAWDRAQMLKAYSETVGGKDRENIMQGAAFSMQRAQEPEELHLEE